MSLLRRFLTLLLACCAPMSWAADFCVLNSAELQQALSTAASNDEADDLRIAQGVYLLNPVTIDDTEPHALTISGDWDPQCIASNDSPDLTILQSLTPDVALLTISSGAANTTLRGLTIRGGFLDFNRTANVTLIGVSVVANDSDGDGVDDTQDDFPNDPDEQTDTDGDGTGDNADLDDDNDGMSDTYENQNGLNSLVDDAGLDLDGDGFTNFEEFEAGTSPNDADDLPSSGLPVWLLIVPGQQNP